MHCWSFSVRPYLTTAVAATAFAASTARAQSVARMIGYDVQHAAGDVVATWGAPFHSSSSDWAAAGGAIALSAAISPLDNSIDSWFLENQDAPVFRLLRPIREGGKAFTGHSIVPFAVGLYAIGLATNNRSIRDGIWGSIAAYTAESVVRTEVVYRLIGRLRPDSLRGDHVKDDNDRGDQYQFSFPGGEAWGNHSLPAGHVANVTACASFLGHRFQKASVAVPAYGIAAVVGIGRLVDRRHWTSDTVLGVLLGYAVGKEVALRSMERRDAQSTTQSNGAGFTIGWQTQF